MKHLSAAELVDEIEGRLPEARHAHLRLCDRCGDQLTAARDAFHSARQVDIPEPSPLFWNHFSNRVSDAVRNSTPEPSPWWRHPAWALACSAIAIVAVLVSVRDTRLSPAPTPRTGAVQTPNTPADDAAWNLLTDVATTVEQDDASAPSVTLRPAEVDRAIVDLSAAERQELRRLLEDEMKRSGN